MSPALGHKRCAIAEGYIPSWSNGPEPQFTNHETVRLLNISLFTHRFASGGGFLFPHCSHTVALRTSSQRIAKRCCLNLWAAGRFPLRLP